jgi:hypothetical protein
MTDLSYEDYQMIYYANRGFTIGTLEDVKRAWYLWNTPGTTEALTTQDLEFEWLKMHTGSSVTDIDDLWYIYLTTVCGYTGAIRDMQYLLYKAG